MSARLRSLPPDLWITALFTLLAVPASWLPIGSWLELLVMLPLVLVLPGYALTAAIFPGREVPFEERLVYTIVFSVAAVAIGGVLLQLILPLNRTTWPLLLAAITCVAVAVAAERREPQGSARPAGSVPKRIDMPTVALLAVAVAVAGWSIHLATEGAHEQAARSHFTSLWIVPSEDDEGVAGAMVGIENEEGHPTSYELVVRQGPARRGPWLVDLADGESRRVELGPWAAGGSRVAADLYHEGRLYRRAYLNAKEIR
jgi:hypothetical protein